MRPFESLSPPAPVPVPKLEAVAGPVRGKSFEFAKGEAYIGRDPINDICVLDSSVSRQHCVIQREEGELILRDLGSRNGTFVNDVPVKERKLAHADKIRVGNSVFVLLAQRGDAPDPTPSVLLRTGDQPAGPTVILRKEDALYLRSGLESAGLPATPRTVRDLNVLLNFGKAVNSARGLEEVKRQVLDSLLEVSPAERVAILLADDQPGEFGSTLGRERDSGPSQTVWCSRTIIRQAIAEGAAVLSNEVADSGEFPNAQSLITTSVRSVLAVPMEGQSRTIGVIYLDSSQPSVRFDEELLQLVTGLANVAALAIENARHMEWLNGENLRLQEELSIEHNMIGESGVMREVLQFVSRVASTNSTVLIWGESGTGKELVARAIHRNSPRSAKPFVAINCAAIADTLLESELFGHEKGAFTGAVGQKKGKLEIAEGGTVFLDEIGELAPVLQAKLLRVLQEREFERVGGTRSIKLDIRLVAATNRDLKAASREGKFREDLYYRLNVVSIRVPALRERREDIPLLASYFASKYAGKVNRRVAGISPKARLCLMQYDWPGNVRELENAIERSVVLGSSDVILPEDLPEAVIEEGAPDDTPVTALHDGVRDAKKQLIEKAIEQAGGNYTDAAKILGVHPNHLFRLIRSLNLKPKRQR